MMHFPSEQQEKRSVGSSQPVLRAHSTSWYTPPEASHFSLMAGWNGPSKTHWLSRQQETVLGLGQSTLEQSAAGCKREPLLAFFFHLSCRPVPHLLTSDDDGSSSVSALHSQRWRVDAVEDAGSIETARDSDGIWEAYRVDLVAGLSVEEFAIAFGLGSDGAVGLCAAGSRGRLGAEARSAGGVGEECADTLALHFVDHSAASLVEAARALDFAQVLDLVARLAGKVVAGAIGGRSFEAQGGVVAWHVGHAARSRDRVANVVDLCAGLGLEKVAVELFAVSGGDGVDAAVRGTARSGLAGQKKTASLGSRRGGGGRLSAN